MLLLQYLFEMPFNGALLEMLVFEGVADTIHDGTSYHGAGKKTL